MNDTTNNFVSDIHERQYKNAYANPLLNHKQLFETRGRHRESLNGWWNYGIDQYDTCLRAKWFEERSRDAEGRPMPVDYNYDQWPKMLLPGCWNVALERCFFYEGSMIFTRNFTYQNQGESRVFLRFGAVNYEAAIFLNRQYIGRHMGGSTPFCVEITKYLQAQNRILVVADNTRRTTAVPETNTDWFNYGGIYRDVELFRLPETYISNFTAQLIPGSNFRKIQVNLDVTGSRHSGEAILEIQGLVSPVKIQVANGHGVATIEASPELWSPENPRLYDVSLTFGEDRVSDRIGFREIRTQGTDIILNGQSIYLKGVCYHEESVQNGKAITEAEIRENIALAKEMGCNYIRLAHYPHTEKTAEIADELGIMLWEEIPVYWAIAFDNPGTYEDAQNQLTELIKRDHNRASVIIWSVGNENADTDSRYQFMRSLAEHAKTLDPTRLVSAACLVDNTNLRMADRLAEHLDVIGFNEYYGWYDPDFSKLIRIFENSRPTKPIVISEFGADARAGARGTVSDLGTEDCQLAIYRKQLATIAKIPYVKGTSPWILYDFRCPRRLNDLQNYYNTKGLLDAEKKYKKPAFYEMQKYYQER